MVLTKNWFNSTTLIVVDSQNRSVRALGGGTNVADEITRVRKQIERLSIDITSKQLLLEDQTFRDRAPEHIVKGLETTLAERRTESEKLKERLEQLEKNVGGAA